MIDSFGCKMRAAEALRRGYWKCVIAALILALATGGCQISGSASSYGSRIWGDPVTDWKIFSSPELLTTVIAAGFGLLVAWTVLSIFLFEPISVGCLRFFEWGCNHSFEKGSIGFAFRHSYGNVVKVMFLRNCYIFCWSLLFVIPGIIKMYEYFMVPYILAEYPDIPADQAFRISRDMTRGNKMNIFAFQFSFIGWILLSYFTLGLAGLFYVNPYYQLSMAQLYAFFKQRFPFRGSMNVIVTGYDPEYYRLTNPVYPPQQPQQPEQPEQPASE